MADKMQRAFGLARLYLPDSADPNQVPLLEWVRSVGDAAGKLANEKWALEAEVRQLREENENLRAEVIELEHQLSALRGEKETNDEN